MNQSWKWNDIVKEISARCISALSEQQITSSWKAHQPQRQRPSWPWFRAASWMLSPGSKKVKHQMKRVIFGRHLADGLEGLEGLHVSSDGHSTGPLGHSLGCHHLETRVSWDLRSRFYRSPWFQPAGQPWTSPQQWRRPSWASWRWWGTRSSSTWTPSTSVCSAAETPHSCS